MMATSGAKNVVRRKQIPVTTEAKPVRAPSPTPDADSIYEVFDEIEAAPPAAAAIESTIKILLALGEYLLCHSTLLLDQ